MGDRLEEIAIQTETLQGMNDLIDKVMKIHDGNDDGVIDKDEFYTPTSGRRQEQDELWPPFWSCSLLWSWWCHLSRLLSIDRICSNSACTVFANAFLSTDKHSDMYKNIWWRSEFYPHKSSGGKFTSELTYMLATFETSRIAYHHKIMWHFL